MPGRVLFFLCNLVLFFTSYAIAGTVVSTPVVSEAIKDLQTFFDERPQVGKQVIRKFQKITMPKLQEGKNLNCHTIAHIFRAAFVRHLTNSEITASCSQLSSSNFQSLYVYLDGVFPDELAPWEQFIKDIDLLSGKVPSDTVVREAFATVRQKTQPQYLEYKDNIRRYLNGLVALNAMPVFRASELDWLK